MTASFVKRYIPGYIGGQEIARRATSAEILYLVKLQDEIAALHNQMVELKKQRANLVNAIQSRRR